MTLELEKYVRKPFYVDAVRVTEENISAVAAWCGGNIFSDNLESSDGSLAKYIRVRVNRPMNERQTKAYVGDCVLYAGNGFKVYTNKAFLGCFERVVETQKEVASAPVEQEPVVEVE